MLFLLKSLHFILSSVELVKVLLIDLLEKFIGEQSKQLPAEVERVEDVTSIVGALSEEFVLELVQEFKEQLIILCQGFLTDDGLHGQSVLALSVEGIELVGDLGVVDSGETFTDGALH